MSLPPIPLALDQMGRRPFSFYPPIVNIEHNEWVIQRATWAEVEVRNTKSSVALSVSRRFIGEVSLVEDPVMIVGLVKELEYREGALVPHLRRVIEMPRAVNDSIPPRPFEPEPAGPAEVVGIRTEPSRASQAGRRIRVAGAASILACVAVAIFLRDGPSGSRVRLPPAVERRLPLNITDDYESVVGKFGPPERDRWFETGEERYHLLRYLRGTMALVLREDPADPEHAYYIGAVDAYGRVLHSVVLPDGQNSAALLKKLR